MDFLGDLGVPSRRCSGESDSLLAEMNAKGEIDAIISGMIISMVVCSTNGLPNCDIKVRWKVVVMGGYS